MPDPVAELRGERRTGALSSTPVQYRVLLNARSPGGDDAHKKRCDDRVALYALL